MEARRRVFLLLCTVYILKLACLRNIVCASSALVVPCNSPCLLVSIATQIRALDYNNVTSHPVISGLSRAVALDIHYSLGYIFWSDVTELNIKRANVDGSSIKVIHNNTGLCDGLAVEWNSSLLYWTDTTNNTISVSDLEGNNKRILVSSNLDKPRGIALDPNYGSMFWTDWGQTPKIERATLSGTQRVAIVTSNLQWPNGIDLDRRNRLLFWVDAGTDRVECIDYHGNNRKLLFQQSGIHVFGVTFLSSSLFFSEWATDGIYKINASLANGTIMSGLVFQGIDVVMGLVAYDSSRQSPVITCQALPAPSNGTRLGCPGNATMYYDTVCQFSCNNGFIGSGSKVRRCQHNGTWSGQDLTCQTCDMAALGMQQSTRMTQSVGSRVLMAIKPAAQAYEDAKRMDFGMVENFLVKLSRVQRYHHRPMESYWDVTQQRYYMTQCAGFLVRKDLKRLVQQLEDVQKMELGVGMTLSVQMF
ncbi:hypothetical protein ACROYT_G033958 [Oculina patagonica]